MTIYWLSFLVFNIDVFLHFVAMFDINPPIVLCQMDSNNEQKVRLDWKSDYKLLQKLDFRSVL